MPQAPTLVLRDIHQPAAPAWWPPAPGWWLAAAVVLSLVAAVAWWQRRKRHERRRIVALFDATIESTHDAPTQVAAMSELLRRAARRRNVQADTLQGDAWLVFLDDGDPQQPFTRGAGRLLLEGGFRRDTASQDAAALRQLARARFLTWMVK